MAAVNLVRQIEGRKTMLVKLTRMAGPKLDGIPKESMIADDEGQRGV